MTDNTHPEALRLAAELDETPDFAVDPNMVDDLAAELRRQHARITELEAQLEAIGAGGVNGPLIGRWYVLNKDGMATLCADQADAEQGAKEAQTLWPHMGPHRAVQLVEAGSASLSANAGEPVAWLYESPMPDGSVFTGASAERLQVGVGTPPGTIEKPLYLAAPQPALSALWMPIETAPKYTEHGAYYHLLLGYAPDEIHEDGFVSQGYWMEAEEDAPDNMGHDGGWVDVHFDFFSCGRSFGAEAYRSAGTQPTHWQPLPPSPSMDGESNG